MVIDLFHKMVYFTHMTNYYGYFDGSCGPKNPGGTARYGFSLSLNGKSLNHGHGTIGSGPGMSNNLAEHYALRKLFEAFLDQLGTSGVNNTLLTVRGDSKLVIYQMNRKWKVKSGLYYAEAVKTMEMLKLVRNRGVVVTVEWVPRERNQFCDELSKKS